MCGRFVEFTSIKELREQFPIDVANVDVLASYNVAPIQEILAIARYKAENHLVRFHWGLVPSWAKDVSFGNKRINARSETIATKPSFRNAFKRRRCLIPADGFYEWKKTNSGKRPVFVTLPDGKPFAFAGIWETWRAKENETAYRSCTIITREASESMKEIHHRMPVILKQEAFDSWLDTKNQDVERLQEIIKNQIHTELINVPVSMRVNSVRNNGPENIRPAK
ncbi:SOS response-associated peptidase [Desulfosarcina cetonica]|uniref:SOS response-associated peptidase n=1 Tax=Desulfosarcina cetonica TaxID=90730 RepID=UPI0006D07141|nr:SOS response-associated peptidase [Desulfosarcina cetonica]